jgi:hypothetical protein
VLEHLALDDFRIALRNTHENLADDGLFRLALPDLEHYAKKYIESGTPMAAIDFMQGSGLGQDKRSYGLKDFVVDWLGHRRLLWMWDFKSVEQELKNVGFRDIRRAKFGDSKEQLFEQVEDKTRWDDCLGIECRK